MLNMYIFFDNIRPNIIINVNELNSNSDFGEAFFVELRDLTSSSSLMAATLQLDVRQFGNYLLLASKPLPHLPPPPSFICFYLLFTISLCSFSIHSLLYDVYYCDNLATIQFL